MGRLLAAAVLVVAVLTVSVSTSAQEGGGEVRIIARKLTDGRIEFGLRDATGTEQLPSPRLFPYRTAKLNTWYASGPVTVGALSDVRVIARKLADGRVEFALGYQGEPWYPKSRFFPYATAGVGRWLRSSPVGEPRREAPTEAPTRAPAPSSGSTAGACVNDGSVLRCSPPAGRPTTWGEYRTYMDSAVAMLQPHFPWIATALNLSGGWTLGDCPGDAAAGCYFLDDERIVLDQKRLAPFHPLVGFGVLIHELAHAYDYGTTPDDRLEDQPSVRHMTAYHVALRSELFADAAKVLLLGHLAPAGYYSDPHGTFGELYDQWYSWGWVTDNRATFTSALNRVPNRPTSADLASAWQGLCGRCGTVAPTVVWADPGGGKIEPPAQPPGLGVDVPQPPRIVIEIDFGCLPAMLNWPDEPIPPECRNDPDVLDYIEVSVRLCRPIIADLESDNDLLRRIAEDSERFRERLGQPTCREIMEAAGQ